MAQLAVGAVMLVGSLYKGAEEKKLLDEQAEGLDAAAMRTMAATSREVDHGQREKEIMHSNALATAAASGAGTGHGMVKLLADLNAEGIYRMMSTLWSGRNEAEGLQYQAEQARSAGDSAVTASYITGVTSALSAYSGMGGFDKAPSAAAAGAKGSGALAMSPVKNPPPTRLWGN